MLAEKEMEGTIKTPWQSGTVYMVKDEAPNMDVATVARNLGVVFNPAFLTLVGISGADLRAKGRRGR